jgi:hypothetical protein
MTRAYESLGQKQQKKRWSSVNEVKGCTKRCNHFYAPGRGTPQHDTKVRTAAVRMALKEAETKSSGKCRNHFLKIILRRKKQSIR